MFLVSNIVWDSASADNQIALFRSPPPPHIHISKYLCPGSDLILSKKTGATEVSLQGLETFTSYYVKVAAFTKEGDGVKSDKVICTTAQDGESVRKNCFSLYFHFSWPFGSQIYPSEA